MQLLSDSFHELLPSGISLIVVVHFVGSHFGVAGQLRVER